MTFSVPSDLARKLVKRVPARERSRFLARAIEKSLLDEEKALVRACIAANRDPDSRAIEREWEALRDPIEEPWADEEQPSDSAAR